MTAAPMAKTQVETRYRVPLSPPWRDSWYIHATNAVDSSQAAANRIVNGATQFRMSWANPAWPVHATAIGAVIGTIASSRLELALTNAFRRPVRVTRPARSAAFASRLRRRFSSLRTVRPVAFSSTLRASSRAWSAACLACPACSSRSLASSTARPASALSSIASCSASRRMRRTSCLASSLTVAASLAASERWRRAS